MVSFVVIGETKIKRIYAYALIVIVFIVIALGIFPYLHPDYRETGYSTRISGLNQDYMDLAEYIKSLNTTSRFVWFPMTFPGYVYISDEANPDHYYIGISPLQIFSRSGDLAGFYGLQTPGEPELNWKVSDLLRNREYEEIGNILKRLNVGYVIVNHEKVPEGSPFVLEQFDFMKYQTEDYAKAILGEKIRDFGTRYSLYTIHRNYSSPTVFLTEDTQDNQADNSRVVFTRTPEGAYDIGPFNVSGTTNLVLMEPYSRLWSLERLDGYKHATVQGDSRLAYGYGNAWALDSETVGPAPVHIRAEFWPNKIVWPAIYISVVSAGIALLYCIVTVIHRKRSS